MKYIIILFIVSVIINLIDLIKSVFNLFFLDIFATNLTNLRKFYLLNDKSIDINKTVSELRLHLTHYLKISKNVSLIENTSEPVIDFILRNIVRYSTPSYIPFLAEYTEAVQHDVSKEEGKILFHIFKCCIYFIPIFCFSVLIENFIKSLPIKINISFNNFVGFFANICGIATFFIVFWEQIKVFFIKIISIF